MRDPSKTLAVIILMISSFIVISSFPLFQVLEMNPDTNPYTFDKNLQYLRHSAPPTRAINLVFQPYLQNTQHDRTTICWETDIAGWSKVEYGTTPAMGLYINDTTPMTFHEINLTGLESGTRYYYRVSTSGATSGQFTFVTAAPYNQPFRFCTMSDSQGRNGEHPVWHKDVLMKMEPRKPEFILHSGDLVETGESKEQWEWFFQDSDLANNLLSNTTLFPTPGNHEHNASYYYHYCSLPGNEQWYSFEWGCAFFISLRIDTQGVDTLYRAGTAQYAWLEQQLAYAANESRFIIVFFHIPVHSSGYHGKEDDNGDTKIRDALGPLFDNYGVDLVFNGHDHNYEHSEANGTYYIVNGGASSSPAFYIPPVGPYSVVAYPSALQYVEYPGHHYCVIDIEGFQLNFTVYDLRDLVIDSFSITKPNTAPRAPEVLTATDRPSDNGEAITLTWTLSHDDGHGEHDVIDYRIFRTTHLGSEGTLLATVPGGVSSYNDTSVLKGVEYYYYLRAFDGVQESNDTMLAGPVQSVDNLPPRPPRDLIGYDTPNDEGQSITLEWAPSPDDQSGAGDVVAYTIYRSETVEGWQDAITLEVESSSLTAIGTRVKYADVSVIDGTEYYYCLRASDGNFLSNSTNVTGPVNASDNRAPSPPTGLKITDITGSAITLKWLHSPEPDVTGYAIFVNATSTGASGPYVNLTTIGKVTEYTVTGLKDETIYFFRLKAFDEVPNYSGFSDFETAKTLDVTPPQAPIIELPEEAITNNPTFILNGLSEPDIRIKCHLDGQFHTETYTDFSGAFSVKITLREGSNAITVHAVDTDGNVGPPAGPITITLDRQAPRVTAVIPQHMNLSVLTTTTISVTFNEAIDRSTISAGTVTIEDEMYEAVAGTVTYDHERFIIRIKPTGLLAYETMYTVKISTLVTDIAGNPLIQAYTWSFQTIKNAPPVILSVSPTNTTEIFEGETGNFSVEATDVEPLQYEWYVDSKRVSVIESGEYSYHAPEGSAGKHEVKVRINDGILKTDHTWQITVRSRSIPENETANGDGNGESSTPGADTRDAEAGSTEALVILLIPVAAAAGGAAVTVWILLLRRKRQ